jgi:hypothetical protein
VAAIPTVPLKTAAPGANAAAANGKIPPTGQLANLGQQLEVGSGASRVSPYPCALRLPVSRTGTRVLTLRRLHRADPTPATGLLWPNRPRP